MNTTVTGLARLLLAIGITAGPIGLGAVELYRGTEAPPDALPEYRKAHEVLLAEVRDEWRRSGQTASARPDDTDPATDRQERSTESGREMLLSRRVQDMERAYSERVATDLPGWRRRHMMFGLILVLGGCGVSLHLLGRSLREPASGPPPYPTLES